MIRLLIAICIGILLALVLRYLWLRTRNHPGARWGMLLASAFLALVVVAVISGRLHWIVSVPAALFAWGMRLAWLRSVLGTSPSQPTAGSTTGASDVETESLAMSLDHETGEIRGTVRKGPHAGRQLDELSDAAVLDLYREFTASDGDSARLLETYLDRRLGEDWRGKQAGATDHSEGMTREEALAMLGLSGSPSRTDIQQAHRRLMQRVHPDQGGTDYLAARLNQARDLLLGP